MLAMSLAVTTCIAIGTSCSNCLRDCALTTTDCMASSADQAGAAAKAAATLAATMDSRASGSAAVLLRLLIRLLGFRWLLLLRAAGLLPSHQGEGQGHQHV